MAIVLVSRSSLFLERMASGTLGLISSLLPVAAQAAQTGIHAVHGLVQGDLAPFFGSLQAVALTAGFKAGLVVTGSAGIGGLFMGFVIKGNRMHESILAGAGGGDSLDICCPGSDK